MEKGSENKDLAQIDEASSAGSRTQTRLNKSKQINPGKEEGIPIQRTRERKVKG